MTLLRKIYWMKKPKSRRSKTPIYLRDKKQSNNKSVRQTPGLFKKCLSSSTSQRFKMMLKRRRWKRRQKNRRNNLQPKSEKKSFLLKLPNLSTNLSKKWCKMQRKKNKHLTWANSPKTKLNSMNWCSNYLILYAKRRKGICHMSLSYMMRNITTSNLAATQTLDLKRGMCVSR